MQNWRKFKMYLLEYFKSDGKTITLQIEDDVNLMSNIKTLTQQVIAGNVITFSVEKLYVYN